MPSDWASMYSGLLSRPNVTMPSISATSMPASSAAAMIASHPSRNSLRPAFFENSVAPIPTIAVLPFNVEALVTVLL